MRLYLVLVAGAVARAEKKDNKSKNDECQMAVGGKLIPFKPIAHVDYGRKRSGPEGQQPVNQPRRLRWLGAWAQGCAPDPRGVITYRADSSFSPPGTGPAPFSPPGTSCPAGM